MGPKHSEDPGPLEQSPTHLPGHENEMAQAAGNHEAICYEVRCVLC